MTIKQQIGGKMLDFDLPSYVYGEWRGPDLAKEYGGTGKALTVKEASLLLRQKSYPEAVVTFGGQTGFGILRFAGVKMFQLQNPDDLRTFQKTMADKGYRLYAIPVCQLPKFPGIGCGFDKENLPPSRRVKDITLC